ncbi:MAG: hypothetical protein QG655_1131 [Actinomycetota bacterium]|nr:hypothetical protein [Actinomycetota bacterium]
MARLCVPAMLLSALTASGIGIAPANADPVAPPDPVAPMDVAPKDVAPQDVAPKDFVALEIWETSE